MIIYRLIAHFILPRIHLSIKKYRKKKLEKKNWSDFVLHLIFSALFEFRFRHLTTCRWLFIHRQLMFLWLAQIVNFVKQPCFTLCSRTRRLHMICWLFTLHEVCIEKYGTKRIMINAYIIRNILHNRVGMLTNMLNNINSASLTYANSHCD